MQELATPTFLSAPKAASVCGVTRNTICTWIHKGKLEAYKTAGGKNLIRPSDLIDFMERCNMFVPAPLREMARADQELMGSESEQPPAAEAAILVVDDDADARSVAVRCLERLGLPILQAESGYEALHLMLKHPEVSLVVLDLMMPGQTGDETFREMRAQHLEMPVIVITGYAADEVREQLAGMSPDRLLTKPYNISDLISAAQELLVEA